jgi:hypothetical protein
MPSAQKVWIMLQKPTMAAFSASFSLSSLFFLGY